MDADTMKLLTEANIAVKTATDNTIIYYVLFVALVGFLVLTMHYIYERWTWIPRNRHTRVYRERF
jgi:hypothetical protein